MGPLTSLYTCYAQKGPYNPPGFTSALLHLGFRVAGFTFSGLRGFRFQEFRVSGFGLGIGFSVFCGLGFGV